MKVFFIIVFALVMVPLCHAQGYYPLNIDNRWDYGYLDMPRHYVYQRTVTVMSDTIMPNGKQYAVLFDGVNTTYMRQEGDSVYQYPATGIEKLLYDFTRQDNDTVREYYRKDTVTTVVHRGERDVFGQMRTVWEFETRSASTSFYSLVHVADSIGYIYRLIEPAQAEYCLGAVIDGITYGTVTAVPSPPPARPTGYFLSQNYPNPFNPSTTISYQIPKQSYVSLKIFDMLGREVSTLVSQVEVPGHKSVTFDASRFSTGIYYFCLQAGNYVEAKKLVFLR